MDHSRNVLRSPADSSISGRFPSLNPEKDRAAIEMLFAAREPLRARFRIRIHRRGRGHHRSQRNNVAALRLIRRRTIQKHLLRDARRLRGLLVLPGYTQS